MYKKVGRGFSYLELMIAVAILLIVLSGLLMTFVYCIMLNESNNNLVVAANDAQYVLEKMKTLNYTAIDDYAPSGFSNLPDETILAPDITDIPSSSNSYIKEITVNVNWTERGRQRNFKLSTRIAK